MAIMQKCCCFSNVRSGSTASGVYSLITGCIYLVVWSYNLAQYVSAFEVVDVEDSVVNGIYAAYSIDIIVAVFLIIASIVLIVGVSKDNKEMLIPYMVAMVALMVLQAIAWIIIFALVGFAGGLLIGSFIVWLLFTGLNITCLICVISQYQELRDGRGKASDVV